MHRNLRRLDLLVEDVLGITRLTAPGRPLVAIRNARRIDLRNLHRHLHLDRRLGHRLDQPRQIDELRDDAATFADQRHVEREQNQRHRGFVRLRDGRQGVHGASAAGHFHDARPIVTRA